MDGDEDEDGGDEESDGSKKASRGRSKTRAGRTKAKRVAKSGSGAATSKKAEKGNRCGMCLQTEKD